MCWMNWNDPENSSFPQPAVQHLKEVEDNATESLEVKAEPCSGAVAEDIIKLLLAGWETGRGHIRVLQVCKIKQLTIVKE